jgi:LmbE family N-acetylglucosaminyl deacetylase
MKLIVSPHADDEVLGCGGLIAKDPQDIAVAILSDKGDGRMEEYYRAKGILGYERTYLAEFQTGTLTGNARMLVTWLDSVISALQPVEIYLPTPGAHQDHIAAYEAGIRASRLSYTNKDAWYVPTVLLYEIPSYTTDLYTIPYQWNRFEGLTEAQMETKMAAIRAYESQANGSFDPAKLAFEHGRWIGSGRNLPFAEQFAVVREVRS